MKKTVINLKSLACAAALFAGVGQAGPAPESRLMNDREDMMKYHLRGRGITNEAVLVAMRSVRREAFVPDEVRHLAYRDGPLPIGEGQTISQPYIVAAMTELLEPEPGDVVLEIGTGSGYQAAVLSQLVKEVYTVEIIPELGEQAAAMLEEMDYNNVVVRIGDGYAGWPEHAPFDGIMVTCGAERVPPPLLEQLKPGGRMVIPVGPNLIAQDLLLIEKDDQGAITESRIMGVRFVPMTGRAMEDEPSP
jgi:protein-L-isoaspartate(D-aspartate) O-methyltransferase